jgi:MFS family permease
MAVRIPPALRQPRFAFYWVGLTFAWTGNQVLVWALLWHIRAFTDLPLALGVVGLIRVVPTILISFIAGWAADAFSRRILVFMTQGIMGSVALLLGLLTLTGSVQLWHIYALLALHSTAYAFESPARYSLTPNLVPDKLLPNAISLIMISYQIGGLVGPALSGLLIDQTGQQIAYFTATGLLGILLVTLLLIGGIPQERLVSNRRGFDFEAIRTGFRFTFRHPLILSSMLLDFFATFLVRADSLMPYFAKDVLGVSATAYGWLSSATMIGAILAGITISQVQALQRQGKLLFLSIMTLGAGATIFGLSRSYPLSMVGLILMGASDSVSSIIRSSIRQLQTPDSLRGRMMGVNQIFFSGGPQLGELKSGLLGQFIGVPLTVALGGIVCILMVAGIDRRWPQLRAYNGDEAKISVPLG